MEKIQTQFFNTPYGELILGEYQQQLCLCDWRYRARRNAVDARIQNGLNAEFIEQESDLLLKTKTQLNEYFHRSRKNFTIPILTVGTDFQKTVWDALLKIPFGQTASYLELAKLVGNVKAVRAVASANGANALSIVIPCHRVIGSDGSLTGYAGGKKAKADLLGIEMDLFNSDLQSVS